MRFVPGDLPVEAGWQDRRLPGPSSDRYCLRHEFVLGGEFQRLLLRYTQALITQISQTAVCNRLHSVEQQLCRWLLLSHDRVDTDELIMTQELIADMLGCAAKALRWLPVTFRI
jgi:hypothetical protein